MHDSPVPDPAEVRRRGVRRVRVVTAALGAAAAMGTGAVAVAVAAEHPAQAASAPSTVGNLPQGTSDGTGSSDGRGFSDGGSSGFQPPATLPGRGWGGSGGVHASSGGS